MKSSQYLLATVLLLGLSGACAEGSPADEEFPGAAGSGGAAAGGGAGLGGQAGKDAGLGGTTGQGGADAAAGGATTGGAAGSAGADGGAGQAGSAGAGGASTGGSGGSGGLVINSGGSSGMGGSAGAAGAGKGGAAGAGGASSGGAAGASAGGSAGSAGATSTGGAAGAAGTGGAAGAAGTTGTGGSSCVPPVSGACDTVPQCGCLPTDNCDVTTVSGETACVAAGTVAPYHNCTNFGQCQVGHTCVGGVCKPFCDTTAECPGSAYRACDQVYADQTPIPSFRVCTQQCNPRAPLQNTGGFSACGSGTLCIATPSGSSDCIGPAGPGLQNSACTMETDCSAGFTCVQVDIGDVRCLRWCTTDYDCPGLYESCYTFTTPLFAGTVEYGVCFDPYY